MTREEAIGTMNYLKHYAETDIKERDVLEEKDRTRFIEALKMAIKALSQEQKSGKCKTCKYWQDNNNGYPSDMCEWRTDETPDADDFCSGFEPQESETWNGIHGQITAPKGTFKKIYEDAESEDTE